MLKSMVSGSAGLFDRYLLPLLPLVTIAVLTGYRKVSERDGVPLAAWLALLAMGYYAIAQTHDYFALLRARLTLTDTLEQRGIPRTRIMAGFEYDAWTQISVAGFYNDARIHKPANVYTPAQPIGFETIYPLWPHTPVVRPDYIVAVAEHPDLINTDLRSARYVSWLPPFHRRCIVQVKDAALASVRSRPIAAR
jgi:hypothetical protein